MPHPINCLKTVGIFLYSVLKLVCLVKDTGSRTSIHCSTIAYFRLSREAYVAFPMRETLFRADEVASLMVHIV